MNVLEVGSANINGTTRKTVQNKFPSTFIGVDICGGPGVDEICDVKKLVERFGQDCFDLVISTEMLEHVYEWRDAISNLKNVLRPGGILLVTTRSKGFIYHGYPHDYWRYEKSDMKYIFSDLIIERLENDPEDYGVFVKARKPTIFIELNLKSYKLYSMVSGDKCEKVSDDQMNKFLANPKLRKISFMEKLRLILRRLLPSFIRGKIRKTVLACRSNLW